MKNKRGIPQAFLSPERGGGIRRATVFDLFEMSRVLTRPVAVAGKAGPKAGTWPPAGRALEATPAALRERLFRPGETWLADRDGQVIAVGAWEEPEGGNRAARVTLLHVDPDHRLSGHGSGLLQHLEFRMGAKGHELARVTAAADTRAFFLACGWTDETRPPGLQDAAGSLMERRLQ